MRTWNIVIVSLCMAAMPSVTVGQGIAKNLDELRLLARAGETVAVTDVSRNEVSGRILSLSPTALTLEVAGRPREFKEGEIARITQRRSDSLGNGALWGLATGAGVAAIGIASAGYDDEDAGWAAVAIALYGGIGAGIGVGVDALITRRQVIFERPAGTTGVNVVPVMTGGRKGVLVRFAF